MRRFCHGHREGHPLVAMSLTEPSLSPPLCGSRSVFCHGGRPLKAQKTSNLVEPCGGGGGGGEEEGEGGRGRGVGGVRGGGYEEVRPLFLLV